MTKHTLLWIFVMLGVLIFSPLITPASTFERETLSELTDAVKWYGEEESNQMVERAHGIYDVLMVKTGVNKLVTYYSTPANMELAPGVPLPAHLRDQSIMLLDYWRNFGANMWLFSLRVAHIGLWLIYMSPFVAAIVFDGIMTRKAKLVSFKYTSPAIFNMAWHLIIAVSALTTVLLAICVPLSAFVFPTALASMGVLLRLMISNIQHSA